MFKQTLCALAAGDAILLAALTGTSGAAKADTFFDIAIGVPGVYLAHSSDRPRCWLPERHLCGPYYGRPYYGRPVYVPPVYGRPVYGWPGYYGGYYAPRPYHYGGFRRW